MPDRTRYQIFSFVLLLLLAGLACNFGGVLEAPVDSSPPPAVEAPAAVVPTTAAGRPVDEMPGAANRDAPVAPQPAAESGAPGFGPIIFCEDFTEDGQPIGPATEFSAGTQVVYALFTFWNMVPGQTWGHYWTWDGFEYHNGLGEAWEEEQSGWTAYYIEEDVALEGEYSLTLYLGDLAVQSASFHVGGDAPVQSGPSAFGRIQFARGVTAEAVPIGAAEQFEYGVNEIYAVFAFYNLADGVDWAREWVYEGQQLFYTEEYWEEGQEGVTHYSFSYYDETALEPGFYTLNLFAQGQLLRSDSFEILAGEVVEEPLQPAEPEEIIDASLMPAWGILASANPEILRELAYFALEHHIEMSISEDTGAKGFYRCSTTSREPGDLYIGLDFYNEASWEEVAAVMAHELTHAVQHIERGACECTVENEYYAFVSEFYVLQETGRMDLLETKWRGAYDDAGYFDRAKLWAAVQEAYPECPEY